MANFFEWDQAKFTVRVSEMDREHQTLIGLMNKLHVLYSDKAPKADVGRALDDLAKYTIKHFADEEALTRTHFAGLDMHKRIHKDLLAKVTSHICGVDVKYGQTPAA